MAARVAAFFMLVVLNPAVGFVHTPSNSMETSRMHLYTSGRVSSRRPFVTMMARRTGVVPDNYVDPYFVLGVQKQVRFWYNCVVTQWTINSMLMPTCCIEVRLYSLGPVCLSSFLSVFVFLHRPCYQATTADIKKAYRKLSQTYHPDVNPSEGAQERFIEISRAYAVLGDEDERYAHDVGDRQDSNIS